MVKNKKIIDMVTIPLFICGVIVLFFNKYYIAVSILLVIALFAIIGNILASVKSKKFFIDILKSKGGCCCRGDIYLAYKMNSSGIDECEIINIAEREINYYLRKEIIFSKENLYCLETIKTGKGDRPKAPVKAGME